MDRLEFIALVSNAPGYPGPETLSALTFGLRLEVVGAAVSAAGCTFALRLYLSVTPSLYHTISLSQHLSIWWLRVVGSLK